MLVLIQLLLVKENCQQDYSSVGSRLVPVYVHVRSKKGTDGANRAHTKPRSQVGPLLSGNTAMQSCAKAACSGQGYASTKQSYRRTEGVYQAEKPIWQ